MRQQTGVLTAILWAFLSLISLNLSAQRPSGGGNWQGGQGGPPKIGKIKGKVLEAKTKAAIEFATVVAIRVRDTAVVGSTSTNDKGEFLLEELPMGGLRIVVDFIGFESKVVEGIRLRPDSASIVLEPILLGESGEELQIAEIVADQPTMRMAIDRKIFDVERSALAAGGTSLDALKNLPMLQVDNNGNILLRGQQVNVLIDGRPINVTGDDRRALLEQIPASMVKNVEVITNPSAKYDPEGVGGLINIVLKKNKLEGFSGSVSGSLGTFLDKYSGSASINIRRKKVNASLSYSYNYNQTWNDMTLSRTLDLPASDALRLEQNRKGSNYRDWHFIRTTFGYDFDEKNSFNLSAGIGPGTRGGWGDLRYTNFNDANNQWLNSYGRVDTIRRGGFWGNGEMSFRHKFNEEGHDLVWDATTRMHGGNTRENYYQRDYSQDGQVLSLQDLQERVFSERLGGAVSTGLDYTRPSKDKKAKLELGTRGTYRFSGNAFLAENLQDQGFVYDSTRSNNFEYNEQIYAVYGTYGYQFNEKFGIQAGLRFEQTFMRSRLVTTGDNFENDYFSWFPSLHFTYKQSLKHAFQFALSRRIERPNGWRLNPFPSYSDPLNIRQGNPFLLPEFINAAEFSHNFYSKIGAISTSLFYTLATDLVTSVRTALPNEVVLTSYENLNSRQTAGVEVVGSLSLAKKLRMNFSARGSYIQMDGRNLRAELNRGFFQSFFSLGFNYEWGKDWSLQAMSSFAPPQRDLQGFGFEGLFNSLAISKRYKKQWTFSARIEDPLFLQPSYGDFRDGFISQSYRNRFESRVFFLTATYTFGKMEVRRPRNQSPRRGGEGGMGGEDF